MSDDEEDKEWEIGTLGEFVAQLLKFPPDKDILFEDGSGRLFGIFTIRDKPGDNIPCHVTVELTELDKKATLKMCDQ